jgi:hypothetical protein
MKEKGKGGVSHILSGSSCKIVEAPRTFAPWNLLFLDDAFATNSSSRLNSNL